MKSHNGRAVRETLNWDKRSFLSSVSNRWVMHCLWTLGLLLCDTVNVDIFALLNFGPSSPLTEALLRGQMFAQAAVSSLCTIMILFRQSHHIFVHQSHARKYVLSTNI